ncbi:MAG: tetratricopeptide repeat protein [Thiopseudomonas sp.]
MSHLISLDTAVVVTGVTKRTLWRWLGSGAIEHRGMDQRGRAMLAYTDIKPKLCMSFADAEDIELLVAADQGCRDAQNDLGILCLEQERADIALNWFNLAAEQGHADAMHFLSTMYQSGNGVERSDTTALLWRAKAAEAGHAIAKAQMARVK